jgi:adenylate kinase family enzyme
MKQKIINLFGAPGAGKSTGTAYIFAKLKMLGVNCEMANEYAKTRVWQEDFKVFQNQLYVVGKQSIYISRLKGKVDVIITDSPLLLGIYYCQNQTWSNDFHNVLMHMHDEYDNYNYFINRVKPYNSKGRFQDEKESDQVSLDIKNILKLNRIPFSEFPGNEEGYNKIVDSIINDLKISI